MGGRRRDHPHTAAEAAKATPPKTPPAKKAPATAPAKTTAAAKAAEAAKSDQLLVNHNRETEVQRLLDARWSRAALTRESELAGSTIMWRVGRQTGPDVQRLDSLLARLDRDQVPPLARKSRAGLRRRSEGLALRRRSRPGGEGGDVGGDLANEGCPPSRRPRSWPTNWPTMHMWR